MHPPEQGGTGPAQAHQTRQTRQQQERPVRRTGYRLQQRQFADKTGQGRQPHHRHSSGKEGRPQPLTVRQRRARLQPVFTIATGAAQQITEQEQGRTDQGGMDQIIKRRTNRLWLANAQRRHQGPHRHDHQIGHQPTQS